MASYLYAPTIVPLTAVSATSQASGKPKERLVSYEFPRRAWWSTGLSQQDLVVQVSDQNYINYIPNPNFGTGDLTDWATAGTGVGSTITVNSADAPPGATFSAIFQDTSATLRPILFRDLIINEDLGGRSFFARWIGKHISGANGQGLFQFFDQRDMLISESNPLSFTVTDWTTYVQTAVAPPGTYRVRYQVRAGSTVGSTGTFRFSGAIAQRQITGVALLHSNFSKVELAHSDNNVDYVDYLSSPFVIAKDRDTGYRKLWVEQAITGTYIRVRIPAGHVPDSAPTSTAFTLGSIMAFDLAKPITYTAQLPLSITAGRPYVQQTPGGHKETVAAGPAKVRLSWTGKAPIAYVNEFTEFASLGQDKPFLFFLNRGNSQEVYYCSHDQDLSVEDFVDYAEVGFSFSEVV